MMCHLWNLLGNLYLRDLRGILSSESFDEPFNGKKISNLCLVNGSLFPNQLAGLGDVHDRICNRFNVDLISLNINPGEYPGGKRCEDD